MKNEIKIDLKNYDGQVLKGDSIRAPKGAKLGGKKLDKSKVLKVVKNSRKGINKYQLSLKDKEGKNYRTMNFKMDGEYKGKKIPKWSMVRKAENKMDDKSKHEVDIPGVNKTDTEKDQLKALSKKTQAATKHRATAEKTGNTGWVKMLQKRKAKYAKKRAQIMSQKEINEEYLILPSKGLNYHIENNIPIHECVFRFGTTSHLDLINEARKMHIENRIKLNGMDKSLMETSLGEYGIYEGSKVPLDLPMKNEILHRGKEVALNKPKRGGSKAYYVYVKDGDKVKKVAFGSGGLKARIGNKEASQNFASRHQCDKKKDRTSPGYWSCNLPRYAKQLGLGKGASRYW